MRMDGWRGDGWYPIYPPLVRCWGLTIATYPDTHTHPTRLLYPIHTHTHTHCIVSLTKTTSRGRVQKAGVIDKLRGALDEFNSLYVFSFAHMRSAKFKDVRIDWRDSRWVGSDDGWGLWLGGGCG